MKKVLKPAEKENVLYYSDFSGKVLGDIPPIEVTIDFNYGSNRDGDSLEWHITDNEFSELLKLIKTKYKIIK